MWHIVLHLVYDHIEWKKRQAEKQAEEQRRDNLYLASDPGGIRAQLWHYLRHYPWRFVPAGVGVVFFSIPTLLLWWVSVTRIGHEWQGAGLGAFVGSLFPLSLAVVCGIRFIRRWQRVRRHFRIGCINPAVVVSESPTIVAVYTDLAKMRGVSAPAIKILRVPRPRGGEATAHVGQRVVVISTYSCPANSPRQWADFNPLPAYAGTADAEDLRQATERKLSDSWQRLNRCLADVPRPYKPGLYLIPPGRAG